MTLGRPSLSLLSILLITFTGCAYGDVAGGRVTDAPAREESQPTAGSGGTGDTGGSSDTSKPSGPTDYDALFDAPADPTTTDDVVTGLWAGKTYYGESRIQITEDKVVIAMKCGTSPANGLEVGALVTANQVKILASKSSTGTYGCSIKVSPIVIKRCSVSTSYDCFTISGSTLTFSGEPLFTGDSSSQGDYTKLSD
jgi:hypothetical protein